MSAQHAAGMQAWEVATINSVLEVERVSQRTLPANSFYKAIASKVLAKYGLNWATVKGA